MRVFALSVCLLVLALTPFAPRVSAFSTGYLLPDYVCHPSAPSGFGPNKNQAFPTSLATYLPYVQRPSSSPLFPYAANQGAAPNNNLFGTNLINVQNTQYILANFHNNNRTAACTHVVLINVTAVASVVATGTTLSYVPLNVAANTIVPGQMHLITATVDAHDFKNNPPLAGQATCDVGWGVVTPTDIANLAIDGLGMFAQDANGYRVGQFTNLGFSVTQGQFMSGVPVTMTSVTQVQLQYWPACGPYGVGIIHNQIICQNNVAATVNGAAFAGMAGQYTGIIWAAPGYLQSGSQLTITGPGVTDGGFGKHTTAFPVLALQPSVLGTSTAVASPIITLATVVGGNLAVFFDPQTNGTVNPQFTAPSYTAAIINQAGTVIQTVSNQLASPIQVPLSSLTAALGTTVNVQITANSNPTSGAVASTSQTFGVALPATFTTPITLAQAIAPCNATYIYFTSFYPMYQNDNQCQWMTALFQSGQVTVKTNGALSQHALSNFIPVAMIAIAAITAKKFF